ncbi:MAG: glycosyltransferase, partial [Candidatus Bathyarchaeia archaeon]
GGGEIETESEGKRSCSLRVAVIIPTYREAKRIEAKLENLYAQDYPKEMMETIVVDSASEDGTPELVERWASRHRDLSLSLIQETARRGKAHALNYALKYAKGSGSAEAIAIADADAFWSRDALRKALKWLSDPSVGAVSCLKVPLGSGSEGERGRGRRRGSKSGIESLEKSYRSYYNVLRIAESKAFSTPIFHGELSVFRREALERIGGFPEDIGADDSHTAARIALEGYRAIIPEGILCHEAIPRDGYSLWRIRRAQHLIQHFFKAFRMKGKGKGRPPKVFLWILRIEAFLHIINPWLLMASASMLAASALTGSMESLIILAIGLALTAYAPYRTWLASQLFLMAASIRNLFNREIVWKKQEKG